MKIHEIKIQNTEVEVILGQISYEPRFDKHAFNFVLKITNMVEIPNKDSLVTICCHKGDYDDKKHFVINTTFDGVNINMFESLQDPRCAFIRAGKLLDIKSMKAIKTNVSKEGVGS